MGSCLSQDKKCENNEHLRCVNTTQSDITQLKNCIKNSDNEPNNTTFEYNIGDGVRAPSIVIGDATSFAPNAYQSVKKLKHNRKTRQPGTVSVTSTDYAAAEKQGSNFSSKGNTFKYDHLLLTEQTFADCDKSTDLLMNQSIIKASCHNQESELHKSSTNDTTMESPHGEETQDCLVNLSEVTQKKKFQCYTEGNTEKQVAPVLRHSFLQCKCKHDGDEIIERFLLRNLEVRELNDASSNIHNNQIESGNTVSLSESLSKNDTHSLKNLHKESFDYACTKEPAICVLHNNVENLQIMDNCMPVCVASDQCSLALSTIQMRSLYNEETTTKLVWN